MSMTITFDSTVLAELEAEALARDMPCEQVVREAVEHYLMQSKSSDPEYEAWIEEKIRKGQEAIRRGDVCAHEEVRRDMAERRARFLARLQQA